MKTNMNALIYFICITLSYLSFSYAFERKGCYGVNAPLGFEAGILMEDKAPGIKADRVRMFSKISYMYAPVFGNEIEGLHVISIQPGFKLRNIFAGPAFASFGISVNPIIAHTNGPFSIAGLDPALGTVLGTGMQVAQWEPGIYLTTVYGQRKFVDKVAWISLLVSRKF